MMSGGDAVRLLRIPLAEPGILLAARPILPDDAAGLMADEARSLSSAVPAVRSRATAARIVARELMRDLGASPVALPHRRHAPPVWPAGISGSLAHDDAVAVAAVARCAEWRALGVDVEPAEPLPGDVALRIATVAERRRYDMARLDGRRLVVAKEAVYKAAHALDPVFLDWSDIEVDLAARLAHLSTGRRIAFDLVEGIAAATAGAAPRIVALAAVAA